MVARIKAAVRGRPDPDFVVMARTDAAANEGVPAAIARSATSLPTAAAAVIRAAKVAATSLYARYCSSRAKSRSLASSRARSSSSSTSPEGSSRAALRSSKVAATTRK